MSFEEPSSYPRKSFAYSERPFAIAGDLNLGQSRFETLNANHFVTESDTQATVDPANRYRHLGVNEGARAQRGKIDRILIPPSWGDSLVVASLTLCEPLVSDHYLLAYRLAWR